MAKEGKACQQAGKLQNCSSSVILEPDRDPRHQATPPARSHQCPVSSLGALLRPQPQRSQRSVPEEFSAPLELPQPLSGLMDDYGVRPKHPWPGGARPLLSQAQQRKRDGPNMADYYYDVNL
ncbi:protein Frey 1 isoform X1 [Psammomys obesus]|uniref:protein Frey 1 isoform X1 n=1 Tax=Psammomys obesus TaxID=48139 RepID=UPI002452A4EC|nr:protein Frey 1 isoform X1 [Psammomys obesus]